MKTKVFFMTLILSLFCLQGSYAQLGNALKRAKEKAKEVVKETTNSAKETVIPENVMEQVQEKAADAGQQAASGKKLKPSAAAIAADPKASDEKVEFLHSKSPSEIRAHYEQELSDDIYFKPYYAKEYEDFYELEDRHDHLYNDQKEILGRIYYMALEAAQGKPMQTFDFFEYIPMKTVDGKEGYAVTGQQPVYGYFAKFSADPKGYVVYSRFVYARVILNILEKAHVANNGTSITLKDKTKANLVEDFDAWKAKMNNELQRLMKIMYQQTPYATIKDYAGASFSMAEKESYVLRKLFFLDQMEQEIADLKNHSQFVDDNDYKQLVSDHNKLKGNQSKWLAELKEYYGPIDLPKTYPMNAGIAAKALAAAKKQFEGRFKVDKVVFLSNDWKINKENKYPYRTISRNMGVGLLTKREDGVWLYRWRNLVQSCDWDGNWKDDFAFQENTRARELKNYKP